MAPSQWQSTDDHAPLATPAAAPAVAAAPPAAPPAPADQWQSTDDHSGTENTVTGSIVTDPAKNVLDDPNVPDARSWGRKVLDEALVNPAKQVAAGAVGAEASANHLTANIFDLLDSMADKVASVTGTDKGGAFKAISDWARGNQAAEEKQAAQLAGGRKDLVSQLYRGGTQGVLSIPTAAVASSVAGPAAGFAALGAISESDKGWKAALQAAAEGALTGAALNVMGPGSRMIRLTGAGAMTYAQARLNGVDNTAALAQATTMAGMAGAPAGGATAGDIARNAMPDLTFKSTLNPTQQAAVDYLQANKVPLNAGTVSGNSFLKGAQKLAASQPLGADVAAKAARATEQGLTRVSGELAEQAHPEPVTPESAGQAVGDVVRQNAASTAAATESDFVNRAKGLLDELHPDPVTPESVGRTIEAGLKKNIHSKLLESNRSYERAWRGMSDPRFAETRPVRTRTVDELDSEGQPTGKTKQVPVMAVVQMPVDIRWMKEVAPPMLDRMELAKGVDRSNNAAYSVLSNVMKWPDFVTAQQAEAALGGLKEQARVENPDMRNITQGTAASLIPKLQESVNEAVAKTGGDAIQGLQQGRASARAKAEIGEFADKIRQEPVQAFGQATWERDAGIDFLTKLADQVPEAMPQAARAFLGQIFDKAQQGGGQLSNSPNLGNAWRGLGPKTQALMAPDPELRASIGRFFADADQAPGAHASDLAKQIPTEDVKAFNKLTAPHDVNIGLLRKVVADAPQQAPEIGRAFIQQLFDRAQKGGGFSRVDGIVREWENLGNQTKKLFYPNPALQSSIDHFFQGAKLVAENPNPSGTAPLLQLGAALTGMVSHPVLGGAYLLGGRAMAKLLFSPAGVRLLTGGLKPESPGAAAARMGKILDITGKDDVTPVPPGGGQSYEAWRDANYPRGSSGMAEDSAGNRYTDERLRQMFDARTVPPGGR